MARKRGGRSVSGRERSPSSGAAALAENARDPGFPGLPHLDARGAARMIDVGDKTDTRRIAVAEAFLALSLETLALLSRGEVAKGDALAVARIAGILAAKRTAELIPLAHPLALTHVGVELALESGGVRITVRVETRGPTGVELEAMTAASIAGLALYDMVKKHERGAELRWVRLLEKSGGASGDFSREPMGNTSLEASRVRSSGPRSRGRRA